MKNVKESNSSAQRNLTRNTDLYIREGWNNLVLLQGANDLHTDKKIWKEYTKRKGIETRMRVHSFFF